MKVLQEGLSPETLVSGPRRSAPVPSDDGSLALFTSTTTDMPGGETVEELRVVSIADGGGGASEVLAAGSGIHDACWLPGWRGEVIYLEDGDAGSTRVMVASGRDVSAEHVLVEEIAAPVRCLKVKGLDDDDGDGGVALAVVGKLGEDGELFNPETAGSRSSARVFDDFHVRLWDKYCSQHRHTIWHTKLVRADGRWTFAGPPHRIFTGDSPLDAPADMDNAVVDARANFDLGRRGIVFVAEDPYVRSPSLHGVSNVWFAPLASFAAASRLPPRRLQRSDAAAGGMGYCRGPRFSPDGSTIGFLFHPLRCPEDSRLYLTHLEESGAVNDDNDDDAAAVVLEAKQVAVGSDDDGDDRKPCSSFSFCGRYSSLLLHVEDCGRSTLVHHDLLTEAKRTFWRGGFVDGYAQLRADDPDRLLVASSSLTDSSVWQVVYVQHEVEPWVVFSALRRGARLGLSERMVSEIWFEGGDGALVQSWVVRPAGFDAARKYPWILIPHGGPEYAWRDQWNSMYNLAFLASQGYVVVAPNIAGSLGFGLDFTKRVYGSWGGAPFHDLVNLVKYLEEVPYLDMSRAALVGHSYGGYLTNWILGHDLAQKFRCVVTHSGLFSLPTVSLQTDILFPDTDFLGPPLPWANERIHRWNPARPDLLKNWRRAPPTLIIHGDKDYRVPVAEGLAAFKTLQAHGVPSRFLAFPDESHFITRPENLLVFHKTMLDWLSSHLSGPAHRNSLALR